MHSVLLRSVGRVVGGGLAVVGVINRALLATEHPSVVCHRSEAASDPPVCVDAPSDDKGEDEEAEAQEDRPLDNHSRLCPPEIVLPIIRICDLSLQESHLVSQSIRFLEVICEVMQSGYMNESRKPRLEV